MYLLLVLPGNKLVTLHNPQFDVWNRAFSTASPAHPSLQDGDDSGDGLEEAPASLLQPSVLGTKHQHSHSGSEQSSQGSQQGSIAAVSHVRSHETLQEEPVQEQLAGELQEEPAQEQLAGELHEEPVKEQLAGELALQLSGMQTWPYPEQESLDDLPRQLSTTQMQSIIKVQSGLSQYVEQHSQQQLEQLLQQELLKQLQQQWQQQPELGTSEMDEAGVGARDGVTEVKDVQRQCEVSGDKEVEVMQGPGFEALPSAFASPESANDAVQAAKDSDWLADDVKHLGVETSELAVIPVETEVESELQAVAVPMHQRMQAALLAVYDAERAVNAAVMFRPRIK